MKKTLFFIALLMSFSGIAQKPAPSVSFWNKLKTHCGKAYEGKITEGGKEGDGFVGERLIMHVSSCDKKTIRIPFFVGENKSRTWVLTLEENQHIKLKHDHRHPDGSEEEVTQYGGTSTNTGLSNLQMFPADVETTALLPQAATNVWWITIDENEFSYNLRRLGSDRVFTVVFDLTKEISPPGAPW